MRFKSWNSSFDLRGEDPKALAEQILTREARLDQSWKDGEGRELRLYVPIEDDPYGPDEIILRRQGGLWRRVRFVERPGARR